MPMVAMRCVWDRMGGECMAIDHRATVQEYPIEKKKYHAMTCTACKSLM